MTDQPPYTSAFFDSLEAGALSSARHMVPMLIDTLRPASVVDVGCGNGAWLSVFAEVGLSDVVGVDGDWVDASNLLIPAAHFVAHDLRERVTLDRRFDLALCLEVAEHIPNDRADTLVDSLVGLADAILFSAAVPGQGGVAHVNEQWPNYWCRLFEARGYTAADVLRARVWENPEVEWWYAQNALLYLNEQRVDQESLVNPASHPRQPLALVHPRMLAAHEQALRERTVADLARQLPRAMKRTLRRWRRSANTTARPFR